MRFLFVGSGYPGIPGALSGSGIGTYLREITLGLRETGHDCDVVVWATGPLRGASPNRERVVQLFRAFRGPEWTVVETREGVRVFVLSNAYWPCIERWAPNSRDVRNLRVVARSLDEANGYDWVEVVSDEGIGIGVQEHFGDRAILRLVTTLAQMRENKQFKECSTALKRLARECRSIELARRVVTHSSLHAAEMQRMYGLSKGLAVIPIGVGAACVGRDGYVVCEKERTRNAKGLSDIMRIVMVGTLDRRKGFDRLRPVLDELAKSGTACHVSIVSAGGEGSAEMYGLGAGLPVGIHLSWHSNVAADVLSGLYREADVLLHLARYESFCLPLIEAASVGLPVVTTKVGIATELMTGDLMRFLVSGDEPVACALAVREASLNKSRLGALLKNRYANCYTRCRMVDNYLNMLATWRGGAV